MLREERLLLMCARPDLPSLEATMGEAAGLIGEGLDWRLFFKRAAVNGIFAQAYENVGAVLEAHGGTARPPQYDEWRPYYLEAMARNMKLGAEAGRAVRILRGRGIPFTPLKGYLLKSLYYPAATTREFADIDILLPDEASSRLAKAALAASGYGLAPSGVDAYHYKMEKRSAGMEIDIELHRRIGATSFFRYPLMEDLWGSLRKARIGGTEVMAMGPEHALLVSAMNALRDRELKLKDIADMLALTAAPGFRRSVLEGYTKKAGWSYILAPPLEALARYRDSARVAFAEEGKHVAYPIPYADLCRRLDCGRRCNGCILNRQGEMDLTRQTVSQAFGTFRGMLSDSARLVVTMVAADYGWRYASSCTWEMANHAANMTLYEIRSRLSRGRRRRQGKTAAST